MGLILMFLVPWIFGFTYYVFNFPLHQKLALTALVLAYFALALPFQFALLTVLLWHLSLLFLPLFYLLFGSFLEMMEETGAVKTALKASFSLTQKDASGTHIYLPGVMSRKKQVIPPLSEAVKRLDKN